MQIGQVCVSTQGHDKGTVYVVAEILSDGTVLVIDGKYKKQDNPKKKNDKHLQPCQAVFEPFAEAKRTSHHLADCEISHYLKQYSAGKI